MSNLGSLTSNNISVPTLNYLTSGSISVPIQQGTFQSIESVSEGAIATYLDHSFLNYLQIELGTLGTVVNWGFASPDTNIGTVNGYTGIYVKGTVQKVSNINPAPNSSQNLRNTVVFEHFGTFYKPLAVDVGTSNESKEIYAASNLLSEFVVKCQTWNEIDFQATTNINPLINNGEENAYNPNYNGLVYQQFGNGGYPYNSDLDFQIYGGSFFNSNYPIFLTHKVLNYDTITGDPLPGEDDPVTLNCGINFYSGATNGAGGLIVKGTYLLV